MPSASQKNWKLARQRRAVRKRREKVIPAPPSESPALHWSFYVAICLTLATAIAFALTWHLYSRQPEVATAPVPTPLPAPTPAEKPFTQPTSLDELMKLTPVQLDHCDIALMDLLCAQGLPGAENLNVPDMLATLDEWASHLEEETLHNMHQFQENPAAFGNSEAYFRMLAFVTVLDQDFDVHYNVSLMAPSVPDAIFNADSGNLFINGLIGPKRAGTCSSMPVLYVALAQRLGYPLYLASAKGHLYTQWVEGNRHMNVEATCEGLSTRGDDFYANFPNPVTASDLKENRYLRPLTGAEELSIFLQDRAAVMAGRGDLQPALACFERAKQLTPTWTDLTKDTKEVEDSVAHPTPQLSEIEHLNNLFRRVHGCYNTPLPRGVEVPDLTPKVAMPTPENSSPIDLISQAPQDASVHIDLPDVPTTQKIMANALRNVPGFLLPNGLYSGSIAPAYPHYQYQQLMDAYDAWPNPRPGQPSVWQAPNP